VTVSVVLRHLDAVRRGDIAAMAADYDTEAVIVRGGDRHEGRTAIADYFATVPERLGGAAVVFDEPVLDADGSVEVRWSIPSLQVSGTDRYVVRNGQIVEQDVMLDGADF
jgi:hypothetical protein